MRLSCANGRPVLSLKFKIINQIIVWKTGLPSSNQNSFDFRRRAIDDQSFKQRDLASWKVQNIYRIYSWSASVFVILCSVSFRHFLFLFIFSWFGRYFCSSFAKMLRNLTGWFCLSFFSFPTGRPSSSMTRLRPLVVLFLVVTLLLSCHPTSSGLVYQTEDAIVVEGKKEAGFSLRLNSDCEQLRWIERVTSEFWPWGRDVNWLLNLHEYWQTIIV